MRPRKKRDDVEAASKLDAGGLIVTALLLDLTYAFLLLRAAFISAVILLVVNTPMA